MIVRRRADQGAGHDSPGGPGVGLGGRRTTNAAPEQAPTPLLADENRMVCPGGLALVWRGRWIHRFAEGSPSTAWCPVTPATYPRRYFHREV